MKLKSVQKYQTMKLVNIKNQQTAKNIFIKAYKLNDFNKNNYSEKQFESLWARILKFYALYDESSVVSFCGIRIFNGGYGRIFDRYFIMPKYRSKNLKLTQFAGFFVERLVDDCISNCLIPFFSIQTLKKRNSMRFTVKKLNEHLSSEKHFHILDGLYCTVPGREYDNLCWQNIAIQKPFKINLKRKPIKDLEM